MGTRRGDLLTVTFTLHNGDTIEVQDTTLAAPKHGTEAFLAFMNKDEDVIHIIKENECDQYIPFHSVLKVEVCSTQSTETYTDEMCS